MAKKEQEFMECGSVECIVATMAGVWLVLTILSLLVSEAPIIATHGTS